MFTTERLLFRAYKASDLDNLLALYNDARVATWVTEGFVVPRNPENFDRMMYLVKESIMFCVLEELEGGAFVGFTAILPVTEHKNRNATFGIALAQTSWHKGYGWEVGNFMVDYAFRWMASHRVSLTVFEGNDRAIELYKRIGFVEEGRTRKLLWIDGGWRDLIHMGVLDDEWAVVQKKRIESTSTS